MKELCVYILECADGKYYTGVTNDLERRMWEHNEGIDPKAYTYGRRPLKLVFSDWFPEPNQAIAFEKQVKGWRKEKKLALIEGRYNDLTRLAQKNKPDK